MSFRCSSILPNFFFLNLKKVQYFLFKFRLHKIRFAFFNIDIFIFSSTLYNLEGKPN